MPKSRRRKKTKKKRSGTRGLFDGRAFLMQQVAHYPLRQCLINKDWDRSRMASISFARNRPDGRVAIAAFAVDLGCLGVKSAFGNPAIFLADYEQKFVYDPATHQVPCDPAFAAKLIQGAYEYAKQLGFDPDPDYFYAREIFGDIDPASCPDVIEYGGEDGKPLYVNGPYDDVEKIMDHLTRRLGPDGFHYVLMSGPIDESVDD